jgi:hypothetical protein
LASKTRFGKIIRLEPLCGAHQNLFLEKNTPSQEKAIPKEINITTRAPKRTPRSRLSTKLIKCSILTEIYYIIIRMAIIDNFERS